ncbi:MAG: hypothetical protein LBF04_05610 [Prevotellaceae bacterium]|jgi:hypothetical protein|nr:hypothetical protein [Prevotellaceae bacterium]
MANKTILEEEIKNTVAAEFFDRFDCTTILGKIDFAVRLKRPKDAVDFNDEYLLWAEAKQKSADIIAMLAQLVLTIGKARTFDKILPPPFLGCYDSEKIAFVPYSEIQDIFYQNDFNWNVAPSNHDTKEFRQVYSQIENIINNDIPWETFLFYFEKDKKELQRFIRDNFIVGKNKTTKIKIDKNNFISIYSKWLDTVKPTIQVNNWNAAKKAGIIDGDFYLADLLSDENKTLKEKLFVLLKTDHYELDRKIDESGFENFKSTAFSDNQKAHTQFWAKYERPPHEDYWDYIIERRDLLVPQDVRERKGSFFTPQIWVELSQRYIADVFGDDWQDEYFVWDCCAGTGNLLAGLINKDNLWASTLDKQDVDVMRDRIKNGANLWQNQVFQFDFLNDELLPVAKGGKLPDELYDIIADETKRKKLIVYINPPYAEATSATTIYGKRENKTGVAIIHKTRKRFQQKIGKATNELFAQFLSRIYADINGCKIAEFSTLKAISGTSFVLFRNFFLAKLEKAFIVPANTFDNVNGKFPIGFKIWDTNKKTKIKNIKVDVFDKNNKNIGHKIFYTFEKRKYINDWLNQYKASSDNTFGILNTRGNDFQNQNYIAIDHNAVDIVAHSIKFNITIENLIYCSIYFAVRKAIPATWLNDRDQFLYPNKKWETDFEFQNDCLAYTLFNNNIQSKYGVNHWIPFSEKEVDSKYKFKSHFMISFLSGKIIRNAYADLFTQLEAEEKAKSKSNWKEGEKREFSLEAQAVFAAGRELWRYYHLQKDCNVNASLYDIKEHFQGRDAKGKMNSKSSDPKYTELIATLRETLKILAKKIEPKVYEYEFLKK